MQSWLLANREKEPIFPESEYFGLDLQEKGHTAQSTGARPLDLVWIDFLVREASRPVGSCRRVPLTAWMLGGKYG